MAQSSSNIYLRLDGEGTNISNRGVLQKYNSQPGGISWLDICPNNENISVHGTIVPVICRSIGYSYGTDADSKQMLLHFATKKMPYSNQFMTFLKGEQGLQLNPL